MKTITQTAFVSSVIGSIVIGSIALAPAAHAAPNAPKARMSRARAMNVCHAENPGWDRDPHGYAVIAACVRQKMSGG